MRGFLAICLGLMLAAGTASAAGSARIIKVLPHLLDAEGRHTPAPSLYERDAHQTRLRRNPDEVSGLRFDIQWRSTIRTVTGLRLRLEVRGSKEQSVQVFERDVVRRSWWRRWTPIQLERERFLQLGEVVAWRVTLWDGDRLLAEQQSFLW